MTTTFAHFLFLLLMAAVANPQTPITVLSVDYVKAPRPLSAAPGQILPVTFTGAPPIPPPRVVAAPGFPLPARLAGFAATLRLINTTDPPPAARSLPILSVEQFSYCRLETWDEGCPVTTMMVQIPFDIAPASWPPGPFDPGHYELVIEHNGRASPGFRLDMFHEKPHIVTTCDEPGYRANCIAKVAHTDGRLVLPSARGPDGKPISATEAKPGEPLVMYAYGLGSTSPLANSGQPTPIGLFPSVREFALEFEWTSKNGQIQMRIARPAFSGLTPGYAGLYQLNFTVPDQLKDSIPCGPATGSAGNLAIKLIGLLASDSTAICVDPAAN